MNRLVNGYVALCLGCCTATAQVVARTGSAQHGPLTYTIVSVSIDRAVTQPLQKIDTVIQVGTNPVNRFTMHYVYHRQGVVKGSIILIPSLVNNFNEYMLGDQRGPEESLAASLARAHIDVYGYSPRTSNLPPHACTTGGVDCSVIKDWDVATYVQDVEFIRSQAVTSGWKPVVGGLSLGGFLGVAAVNANPSGYSGLLLWEAAPYSTDPVAVAMNAQNCANVRAAIASGLYWEENLPLSLKDLARNGEAATISFFGVPQPGVSGTPNWIQLAADPTLTHYQFAWFPRVFEFIMAFNNVESLPVITGFSCTLAGDRTYISNLREFRAPILAIEAGLGFGPYMQETLDATSSTKVRIAADPAFGHLDAYLTADYQKYTTDRILDWLKSDVFRH
jgi:pimeloyl-ACP methyl ester carboxylesterase